jgi:hypothetical protein
VRLAQSSLAYGNTNRSWLGSALESQENNLGVTLDLSLFPTGTFASGGPNTSEVRVLSGTVIGIVTATGLAGPYDSTAGDGRQTAVGLLLNEVEGTNASPYRFVTGAVVRDGIVFRDRLPFAAGVAVGALAPAAETTLRLIDFRNRGTI